MIWGPFPTIYPIFPTKSSHGCIVVLQMWKLQSVKPINKKHPLEIHIFRGSHQRVCDQLPVMHTSLHCTPPPLSPPPRY